MAFTVRDPLGDLETESYLVKLIYASLVFLKEITKKTFLGNGGLTKIPFA